MIRKLADTKRIVNRRQFISTVSATGIALGGLGTSVAANENRSENNGNGKIPLVDGSVDLLVYWSSGDGPNEFNYPIAPPASDRGLFFPGHDPADSGLLDYSRFKLSPNANTLHNEFELFQGALLESKPKPYPLVHQGDGIFKSRGQVLNFDVPQYDETLFGEMGLPSQMLPPIEILADDSWRAVGTDIAKLETDDNGVPKPVGEWGVTRVDVYSSGRGRPEYELSLLYLIWGAEERPELEPYPDGLIAELMDNEEEFVGELIAGIPDTADTAAQELIETGQLNMGGQPRGR